MTDAQTAALRKSEEILGEHFDAFVICYQYTEEGEDNTEFSGHTHFGGFSTAVGLLEVTKQKIVRKSIIQETEEQE